METIMEIIKNLDNDSLTIELKGRLDTTTAPDLENELNLDGVNSLVLNFKDLDYVSSAGLRVLLGAQKKMNSNGGSMVIKEVKPEIMEVFEMTGFDSILTIE